MHTGQDRIKNYDIHGVGIDSIRDGFSALGMPSTRFTAAMRLIRMVTEANKVQDFFWYTPPTTNELSCYWDDHKSNVLWVTPCHVHIRSDRGRVVQPDLPTNWSKEAGKYAGWLLPGCESGAGGGPPLAEIKESLCPDTFLTIPVGSICPQCDIVHD